MILETRLAFPERDRLVEELWAEADLRLRAEKAFAAARRRRLLGRLRPVKERPQASAFRASGEFELDIEEIAGMAGEGGPMPILPRSLARAWRDEYTRLERGSERARFEVAWEGGEWRLGGGIRELLRLEALRSRGEPVALAVRASPCPEPRPFARGNPLQYRECRGREAS